MGVKRLRKTRGAEVKPAAKELRPSDVAWVRGFEQSSKGRLGKPTLGDDELAERRGAWDHLLETYWGAVGWELKCARSLEDVEKAFQPLGGQPSNHLIAPFLRSSTEPATFESIRKTRHERSAATSQLSDAEDRRNKQAELVSQAKGAVFELGRDNVAQLRVEVKRRKENIRTIRIRLSNKKAEIRRAEVSLEQSKAENQEALQAQIRSLGFELQKIETEYSEEKKILQQIEDRLHAISPERERMAAEILGQHEVMLDATEKAATEARRKWEELEKRLADQEAHYCRTQLLKFTRDRRYAHNPRNLANALAGLPYMGCRRSAARCAKLPYTYEPYMMYRVFEFVERTWRLRRVANSAPGLELFRAAIAKLPRSVLVRIGGQQKRKRMENYFRRYLEENWAYLKEAIEYVLRGYQHPGQVPYLVTARFHANLSKPRTQADIFFAQQERLLTS